MIRQAREGRGQAWQQKQHLAAVPLPSLGAWLCAFAFSQAVCIEGGELGQDRSPTVGAGGGCVTPWPFWGPLAARGGVGVGNNPVGIGRWQAVTKGGI